MRHEVGSVEVVTGSMFSGKTDELIRRLRRAVIARQEIQVFKPAVDTRYEVEKVTSHAGSEFEATPVASAQAILDNTQPSTTFSLRCMTKANRLTHTSTPYTKSSDSNGTSS